MPEQIVNASELEVAQYRVDQKAAEVKRFEEAVEKQRRTLRDELSQLEGFRNVAYSRQEQRNLDAEREQGFNVTFQDQTSEPYEGPVQVTLDFVPTPGALRPRQMMRLQRKLDLPEFLRFFLKSGEPRNVDFQLTVQAIDQAAAENLNQVRLEQAALGAERELLQETAPVQGLRNRRIDLETDPAWPTQGPMPAQPMPRSAESAQYPVATPIKNGDTIGPRDR